MDHQYVLKSLQAELDAAQILFKRQQSGEGIQHGVDEGIIAKIKDLPFCQEVWFVNLDMGQEYWKVSVFEESTFQSLAVVCKLIAPKDNQTPTVHELVTEAVSQAVLACQTKPSSISFETEKTRLQCHAALRKCLLTQRTAVCQDRLRMCQLREVESDGKRKALKFLVRVDPDKSQSLSELVDLSLKLKPSYVTEKAVSLGKWNPPRDSLIPKDWFCRAPAYKGEPLIMLLGWRTNLRLAVLRADPGQLERIVNAHDANDIRKACEHFTLLSKACERGIFEIVKILVDKAGCNINRSGSVSVGVKTEQLVSISPLCIAACWGWKDIVQFLLDRGASTSSSSTGHMPLDFAALQGHVDIVSLLLEQFTDDFSHLSRIMDGVIHAQNSTNSHYDALPFRRTVKLLLSEKPHHGSDQSYFLSCIDLLKESHTHYPGTDFLQKLIVS